MGLVWRKRGLNQWQRLVVILLHPLLRMAVKRRWIGQRHIPASGAALIVANHVADVVDPLTFGMFLYESGRFPHYLAKDSLFRIRVVGRALRGARQIPVYRGTADAKDALRDAVAALERGEVVVIYPEGSVTADPDWWPMTARTGVARLALDTDVPVIPVAQWGAQRVYDRHRRAVSLVPRKTVTVLAGPPVDLREYRDRPVTRELLREVADHIMGRVRDQLGQIRNERPPDEFHPNQRRRPVDPVPGEERS